MNEPTNAQDRFLLVSCGRGLLNLAAVPVVITVWPLLMIGTILFCSVAVAKGVWLWVKRGELLIVAIVAPFALATYSAAIVGLVEVEAAWLEKIWHLILPLLRSCGLFQRAA